MILPRINRRINRRIRRGMGRRVELAVRLFLASGLVIVAGAGTLLIVALLFAPPLFQGHLDGAGVASEVHTDIDAAFAQALLVSLAVAVTAATVAASAISWLVSRRLAAPVQDVAHAAQRLADGHYDTVVPDPRLGPEFTTLTRSINQLSGRLADTETTRRRLTADLAHQLRTPLASVQATVEAMADGVLAPDERALATLSDQTARLRRLVADLEKISRAEERQLLLHPSRQSLTPVAQHCKAAITDRYRAGGVALTLEADPATPQVRMDADRIAEAITNLLDNALRHTPPGGRVTLSVAPDRLDADTGETRTARARLEVCDTGEGFHPPDADRLFERFYRAGPHSRSDSSPGGGSGIGLTIARAIVEAHSGHLRAHSQGPDTGADFTITLPADTGR
jgi:two-component system sensor histidine kinase BaeS